MSSDAMDDFSTPFETGMEEAPPGVGRLSPQAQEELRRRLDAFRAARDHAAFRARFVFVGSHS